MSAFLGPIHFWLYNKITTQEAIVQYYLGYAKEHGMEQLEAQVDTSCGVMPKESLEEIIDETNIHGWLQQKIALVEARLGVTVTNLLSSGVASNEKIMELAYQFGKQHALPQGITPEEAYQRLNDILVDGMPCDHVNVVLSQDPDKIVWQRRQCVHEAYWNAVGGNVAIFYELRSHWVKGMIESTGLSYQELENDCYQICK